MFNKYKNLSASGLVKTGSGKAVGVIINSHTSGTLKLWDSTTADNNVLCNTITFSAGLYATIGGTADITIVYK